MKLRGYEKAAVVFLISRVGTSEDARKFLEKLRNDKEVGHMVYSSKDDLNEKWEAFKSGGDNAAYTSWVSINLSFLIFVQRLWFDELTLFALFFLADQAVLGCFREDRGLMNE
jgi:hypothetical protein